MPDQEIPHLQRIDDATVVEMVSSIAHDSFGLGYAALNLAAALERAGTNVFLVCVDQQNDAYEACEEARFPRERLIRGSWLGPSRLRFSPFLLRRILSIPSSGKSVIHLHGMWTYMSWLAGALRKRWQCPLITSPHGSVNPYALSVSARKKALATFLYEHRNFSTAACLWALTEREKTSIREYGYQGRVAVIPNGVRRSIDCSAAEICEFRARHRISSSARVVLFLSRIAVEKNLPQLLRAFARNICKHPEWLVVIAGNDERGYIRQVEAVVSELAIGQSVRFIGPVSGKKKALAFSIASIFALPSRSEGLPITVLEAMEYGKPVFVTDVWTLPGVNCAAFGWRVPLEEHAFETGLSDAMSTSDHVLREKGRIARATVRELFDWDTVAQQARVLYGSLLAAGDHPAYLSQSRASHGFREVAGIQSNTIANEPLERN